MRKAVVGLRPSFSAQVRLGEPGAPVPSPIPLFGAGKLEVKVFEIPHLAKNERDARISCTLLQPSSACAAFIKESRMEFTDLTKPHRKSGVWGTRRSFERTTPFRLEDKSLPADPA
jgi:hypothetical protein